MWYEDAKRKLYSRREDSKIFCHFYSVFGLLASLPASCDPHDWDVDRDD